MFLCCIHAKVDSLWPVGFLLNTCILQTLLMLPFGPQSSVDTTIKPTSHNMSSINAPIMTIAGRSRRLYISQNRMKMKNTVRAPTVMKYGKYLSAFEVSLLLHDESDGATQLSAREGRSTYHGTPSSNRSCVCMNMAKTPMMLPEVSNMVKIHRFSEKGGQLYVRTREVVLSS